MLTNKVLLNSTVSVAQATVQNNFRLQVNTAALANRTGHWLGKTTEALNFYTFYHPHVARLVERLNIGGVDLLMKADTSQMIDDCRPYLTSSPGSVPTDDVGATFNNYKPGSTPAPYILPLVAGSIPRENFDFSDSGAYSKYNWELFYHIPLYIATRLSNNGKFDEAMQWFHYIFNPTSNIPSDPNNPNKRYWEFLPFQTTTVKNISAIISSLTKTDQSLTGWQINPFDPFIMARTRITPFMKNVIMRYIDNLMSWGDNLYRMNTMESINEATQLYIIAAHILGPKPQKVPSRVRRTAETYNSLKKKGLDAFSDAKINMETLFPYSGNVSAPDPVIGETSGSLLGIASVLYFCIPNNDDLLKYWTNVGDRLFNIRHCKNIEGVDQVLALFAPPIDPALLVKASAQGLSIGSILADLNTPFPLYRFNYLLQKANEYCNEVKSFGSALLAALEKKDAEDLARVRASQESGLLDLITGIKERQILEAKAAREGLLKSRETAQKRMQYYVDLLGITGLNVPVFPEISDNLNADSSLPSDTLINEIKPDVDIKLSDSSVRGVKLIPKEKEEFDSMDAALQYQEAAGALETVASIFHVIPNFNIAAEPVGVGLKTEWGLSFVANAMNAIARGLQIGAVLSNADATKASKFASYIRREQEWGQQANMAAREIIQLDKQITASDIRIQIVKRELSNHKQQLVNAQAIEQKLTEKFTNTELYTWLQEQLYDTFKQVYQLAYDMSKKAETAYRFELGKTNSNFIQYGYWDSSYQGLSSGDKLQLALKQMDKSFIEENLRELELTKHISLVQLHPLALIQLKETGTCYLDLPEELFDMDYPGHYFRRIKSVSITIPCIAGPYTTINSTLRLLRNSIRINTNLGSNGQYEHNNDNGVPADDVNRFVENNITFKVIATSSAQNDSGIFELNFRDERYLPFEGAGAISSWKLELNGKYLQDDSTILNFAQFDYDSVSDVIIHIKYTAREDAGGFKNNVLKHLGEYINKPTGNGQDPFVRLFSLRHEFANEWFSFLNQEDQFGNQVLNVNLSSNRYSFFDSKRTIKISKVILLAKSKEPGLTSKGLGLLSSAEVPMQPILPNPPTDPGQVGKNKNANVQAMVGIISNDLVQTTFEYSAGQIDTGQFIIINPKSSNFLLTKDGIKDLIMIVSYQLSQTLK